jgi:hypothetical protein
MAGPNAYPGIGPRDSLRQKYWDRQANRVARREIPPAHQPIQIRLFTDSSTNQKGLGFTPRMSYLDGRERATMDERTDT